MSHYWKFYILIELLSRIYIKRALSYGSFMLRGHRWTKAVVGMKGFPAVASGPSLAHLRLEASSFFALMQFLLLYSLYREMLSFLLESSRQPIKISAAHHSLFLTKFCFLAKVGRERISKHSFFFLLIKVSSHHCTGPTWEPTCQWILVNSSPIEFLTLVFIKVKEKITVIYTISPYMYGYTFIEIT